MKSIPRRLISATMIWPLVVPLLALAHHHHPVYYSEELVQIEGELVSYQWRNPHPTWQLSVTNDAGEEELWTMEAATIYLLQRAGASKDMFRIGDRLTVSGLLSRREDNLMLAHTMVLPDGRDIVLWGKLAGRFNDAAKLVNTAREERGIFRVWSLPAELFPGLSPKMRQLPLTEAAIAGRAAWDPLDNYTLTCERGGMPRIMAGDDPVEFIDNGETITLRMTGIERTIHMDRAAPPEDTAQSYLGFSIGTREGGTLVVTTTHINWPYLDDIGTPQTEAMEVVERFTLSEDQSRLDLSITPSDPATFTETVTVEGYLLALGEEVQEFQCEYEGRAGE
jgi:hypothetical protein